MAKPHSIPARANGERPLAQAAERAPSLVADKFLNREDVPVIGRHPGHDIAFPLGSADLLADAPGEQIGPRRAAFDHLVHGAPTGFCWGAVGNTERSLCHLRLIRSVINLVRTCGEMLRQVLSPPRRPSSRTTWGRA